jgi:hypothetical protein
MMDVLQNVRYNNVQKTVHAMVGCYLFLIINVKLFVEMDLNEDNKNAMMEI